MTIAGKVLHPKSGIMAINSIAIYLSDPAGAAPNVGWRPAAALGPCSDSLGSRDAFRNTVFNSAKCRCLTRGTTRKREGLIPNAFCFHTDRW